jgi:hypothetical protein
MTNNNSFSQFNDFEKAAVKNLLECQIPNFPIEIPGEIKASLIYVLCGVKNFNPDEVFQYIDNCGHGFTLKEKMEGLRYSIKVLEESSIERGQKVITMPSFSLN